MSGAEKASKDLAELRCTLLGYGSRGGEKEGNSPKY